MAELEPFSSAPITEAVLDIRFGEGLAPSFEGLARFVEVVKADYPQAKKVGEVRAELRADLGTAEAPRFTQTAATEPLGYQCISEDRKQIVQPRINGFVFSRLRPYDRWSTFKAEARRLFDLYISEFGKRSIQRVAIRTINRLDIPGQKVDLKEWIRTGPEVSPVLSQELAGFFMQLHLPCHDVKAHCIINETLVSPEVPNATAVILDIDLFRVDDIPQEPGPFWALMDQLRDKKNDIFLGCITEKMKETFK
ncbi:MAG: TIGR04255 family protein [Phycisphaerales bacterium]|jgi:uncharacterized protein (TIGR04255 family)|nr:TIGR04255 family protein [Phycisphaerales bacterium]